MKRLGIFNFYDADGIVDDYVTYLLDDMVENLSQLCIIVNGELTSESEEILRNYTDDVIIHSNLVFDAIASKDVVVGDVADAGVSNNAFVDNIADESVFEDVDVDYTGFDTAAFKDTILYYFGFDKIGEFDELIFFNNSFFGPIYPFKEMFDVMDNKDLDFWGVTAYGETLDVDNLVDYGYMAKHLQTYFLAFRKNLVKSEEFQDYWTNSEYFETFKNNAFKYDAILTKYFSDSGFKWEAYVDTSDIEASYENTMDFLIYDVYDLLANKRLPIMSRKSFNMEKETVLRYNLTRDIPNAMKYLEEETDYDVSLIYKYLLRTMDPARIVDILDLVKIVPKNNLSDFKTDKKVLVIAHLFYADLWEYAFDYLKNIPEYIDLVITTDIKEKKVFFEDNILAKLNNKSKVILVNPRGRDMSALLVGCKEIIKDYDYFCFVHDKKSAGKEYITIGASFRDLLWENSLASPEFIDSIVKEFDENPDLGLIVPPKIYQGTYFFTYKNKYWTLCFDEALDLLDMMDIDANISLDYSPLSIGSCFWAKYDALKPLFDLDLEYGDFPPEPLPADGSISHAIERIHGYVAAGQGYLTEEVMTEDYGRSELYNFRYMLSATLNALVKDNAYNDAIDFSNGFNGFIDTLPNRLNFYRPLDIKRINSQWNSVKQENIKLKEVYNVQVEHDERQLKYISDIMNSSSWKATKSFRKVGSFFKGNNDE